MYHWYPYLFLAKLFNVGEKKKKNKRETAEMEEDNDGEAHLKCLLKCEGMVWKLKHADEKLMIFIMWLVIKKQFFEKWVIIIFSNYGRVWCVTSAYVIIRKSHNRCHLRMHGIYRIMSYYPRVYGVPHACIIRSSL